MQSGAPVLDTVADGFSGIAFVTGASGELEHLSRSFYDITGADPDVPPIRALRAAVHPDDWSRVRVRWATSVAARAPFQSFLRLRGGNGQLRWLMVLARRVGAPEEDAARWFGVMPFMDDLPALQLAAGTGAVWPRLRAELDPGEWMGPLRAAGQSGQALSLVHEKLTVATTYAAAAAQRIEAGTPASLQQARAMLRQVTDELVAVGRLVRAGRPVSAPFTPGAASETDQP